MENKIMKKHPRSRFYLFEIIFLGVCFSTIFTPNVYCMIHSAPIVIEAFTIKSANYEPISNYRLFATLPSGEAVVIPFQIDEINSTGDFVLDRGNPITKFQGNGVFDGADQLAFMGNDVGEAKVPTIWKFKKPDKLFEIKYVTIKDKNKSGAVYLGIYTSSPPPPLSTKSYVRFNERTSTVSTDKFTYQFDTDNYLLSKFVSMKRGPSMNIPVINSSTFYLKGDLKYFLTFEINQKDIGSKLESYKLGPIRDIFRIHFHYTFLKMKFRLGMFTEVSIYSNAVHLPAILENPLSTSTLNYGSSFYYGFSLIDSPSTYRMETNFPKYVPYSKNSKLLNSFTRSDSSPERYYWLSMSKPDRLMYMELIVSERMRLNKNFPSIYTEDTSGLDLVKSRSNDSVAVLGKSPVNLAMNVDLYKFAQGMHLMSFKLYFNNSFSEELLNEFKDLRHWYFITAKIDSGAY